VRIQVFMNQARHHDVFATIRSISRAGAIYLTSFVLVSAGCSDSPTQPSAPDPLALHGRIVFESIPGPGPGAEIVSTAMDGSDLRRISDPSTAAACPSLSPDWRWIAYYRREVDGLEIRSYFVELMRSDGTQRQIILEILAAAWSTLTGFTRNSSLRESVRSGLRRRTRFISSA
jgi:hypothetical protein